jgi:putative hydrolase of the HAD superfamily
MKTIIFDLGKTLIAFELERGYREMEKLCGYTAADIRGRIAAAGLVEPFEAGLLEPGQFFREISAALGMRTDYRRFCDAWSGIFLPEPLIPDGMIEALGTRYRLLLLSNTNSIHFDWVIREYRILQHFDDFVLSFRVKQAKPSPAIYHAALEKAGCAPQECFYTDDTAPYVEAARREGIPGVQFQSVEQLQRDMRGHGIAW